MPKSREFVTSSESDSDYERPAKKKKKEKESKPKASSSNSDAPEDGMYALSKMRFVNVSEFKGKKLVNIREYYEKDGKQLPGRKGISLSADQWNNLKKYMDKIDEALDD